MNIKNYLVLISCSLFLTFTDARAESRLTAFISDLHMGLGRTESGEWHPYEDFRWSGALKGFLDAVAEEGHDNVDLVIVGDFLELWQIPDDIKCRGTGPDAGCSIAELVIMTKRIVAAHKEAFEALREFSQRGQNHIHVIPGNHDAALLLAEVWQPVAEALESSSGRITLVPNGLWRSSDGRMLAEHGHQIGSDVNRFANWPVVTTQDVNGGTFMIRPWGERFVQMLFNNQERQYPIIDNLSPESAGARYRMADRGVWGTAADMANFIAFNIFETSVMQKGSVLILPDQGSIKNYQFNREAAVAVGYQLFMLSLAPDDPLRQSVESSDSAAIAVRAELSKLASSLPDEELKMLCQNAIILLDNDICESKLGAIIGSFVPKDATFKKHIVERRKHVGDFEVFVYGHTHQWEKGWNVNLDNADGVTVFNTGAFQRLANEDGFLRRAKEMGISESEALKRLRPENFAPCYGAVIATYVEEALVAELRLWQMEESGIGRFRSPGVTDCN